MVCSGPLSVMAQMGGLCYKHAPWDGAPSFLTFGPNSRCMAFSRLHHQMEPPMVCRQHLPPSSLRVSAPHLLHLEWTCALSYVIDPRHHKLSNEMNTPRLPQTRRRRLTLNMYPSSAAPLYPQTARLTHVSGLHCVCGRAVW